MNYDSSKLKRFCVIIGLKNDKSWLSSMSSFDCTYAFETFDTLDLSSLLSPFFETDLPFLDYLSTDFLDFVSSPLSFLDLVSLGGLSATLSLDLLFDFFSLIFLF